MGTAAALSQVSPAAVPAWSAKVPRDFRHVLDALQAGVIILDPLARVEEMNAPASRLTTAARGCYAWWPWRA